MNIKISYSIFSPWCGFNPLFSGYSELREEDQKKRLPNKQETETVASGLPATRPTRDLAQVYIFYMFQWAQSSSLLTSFCV
jgi:hypothetical protein